MIKSIKYITFFLGCLSMVSCLNDFLDQVADERTDITINSESDEANVIMMLNTAYPEANYAWIAELSSDNLTDNQSPHLPFDPDVKQILSHYNFPSSAKYDDELYRFDPATTCTYTDWDSPGFVWSYYYNSISTVNYAINSMQDWIEKNDGKISDKLRAALAEAKLIRAYDHFILANLFCQTYRDDAENTKAIGLPYITDNESKLIVSYDRGNLADLYEKIEEDLEAGLKDISEVNMGPSYKYHFNTNAAHAFAARYYLYTRKYDKVIEHANVVLPNDSARAASMLQNYADFSDCVTFDDYAKVWQHPKNPNNLMLICTASILYRKMIGNRYSYSGENSRGPLMIRKNHPFSLSIFPIQSYINGSLYGNDEYGFICTKIGEEFEYSDKIAGIGVPHIIQRAFTSSELLLMRAEAHIMLGHYDEAAADLMLYWNSSFDSFSAADKKSYERYFRKMDMNRIKNYYGEKHKTTKIFDEELQQNVTIDSIYTTEPNCFTHEQWQEYAHSVSSSFNIAPEAVTLLNCLNDVRRYETCYEGLRFFDVKRWGIPYSHTVGLGATIYDLPSVSLKRAIEVPWETISSGLASSRPEAPAPAQMKLPKYKFVAPSEK